jgi:hypothetical protein
MMYCYCYYFLFFHDYNIIIMYLTLALLFAVYLWECLGDARRARLLGGS